jgi:hypothetical protein
LPAVASTIAALLVTAVCAAPRPPAKPAGAQPPLAAPEQPPAAARDEGCLDRLTHNGITFEAVALAAASPGCIIDQPVRIRAVAGAPPRKLAIRLPDAPTLACRFGERFGLFLRDLADPVIAGKFAVELDAVRTGPGYECRNRNRAVSGKLSAHASGIAVDIAGFELADGRRLPVAPAQDARARATIDAIRTAACGWFTTVLGPGSDAAHADHLHVDILQHGSSDRYRICE